MNKTIKALADKLEGQKGQELIAAEGRFLVALGNALQDPDNALRLARMIGRGLREIVGFIEIISDHMRLLKEALERCPKGPESFEGGEEVLEAFSKVKRLCKEVAEEE